MKIEGTNLSMIRGDSETITIKVKSDGVYVDLEFGDTIYFTVKLNTSVETKLIQKIITAFDAGIAVIDIEPEDTKLLAPKSYKYDIQWVTAAGRVTTIIPPSIFTIEPEVTYD
jgi:hypothetical protein